MPQTVAFQFGSPVFGSPVTSSRSSFATSSSRLFESDSSSEATGSGNDPRTGAFQNTLEKATQRPDRRNDSSDPDAQVRSDDRTKTDNSSRLSKTRKRDAAKKTDRSDAADEDDTTAADEKNKVDPQTVTMPGRSDEESGDADDSTGNAGLPGSAGKKKAADPRAADAAALAGDAAAQKVAIQPASDPLKGDSDAQASAIGVNAAAAKDQAAQVAKKSQSATNQAIAATADEADGSDDPAAADGTTGAKHSAGVSALGAKLPARSTASARNAERAAQTSENSHGDGSQAATTSLPALPGIDAVADLASQFDFAPESPVRRDVDDSTSDSAAEGVASPAAAPGTHATTKAAAKTPASDVAPEARFAEDNHEKIVSGVRAELLPNGGTMHLRLDPPELGSLQVSMHLRDGVMTASFQTSNSEATQLLSHSLSDLRATLQAHGISVEKLHVQQAPADDNEKGSPRDGSSKNNQTFEQQQESRREQQRKDAMQRMWDKLAGKAPIDFTA